MHGSMNIKYINKFLVFFLFVYVNVARLKDNPSIHKKLNE